MDHKPICMKDELENDPDRFCACNSCDLLPMKKKVTHTILELPKLEVGSRFAFFLADFKAKQST